MTPINSVHEETVQIKLQTLRAALIEGETSGVSILNMKDIRNEIIAELGIR